MTVYHWWIWHGKVSVSRHCAERSRKNASLTGWIKGQIQWKIESPKL